MIITDTTMPINGAGETLARNLIARLNSAYPAFAGMWRVAVNQGGGVIEVTNAALSSKWGFLMHIDKIDTEGRKVVAAAGELLERFRIARDSRRAVSSLLAAKRDFRGELIADV